MNKPTAKLIFFSALLLLANHSFSQMEVYQGAESVNCNFLGRTSRLIDLKPQHVPYENDIHLNGTEFDLQVEDNIKEGISDTLVEQIFELTSVVIPIEPILNFDGIDVLESVNAVFPNPNGDVSPDFYIQVSNAIIGSVFKIFDKQGNTVYGPSSLNTIWQTFGLEGGFGSPIVLWDQSVERWLITENGSFGSNTIYMAVSQTSDPLGNWLVYQIEVPDLPEDPKPGIWHDAYYLTTIENNQASLPIYAINKESILNGELHPSIQRVSVPKYPATSAFAFQNLSPVDWDGSLKPPQGSPHLVLRLYDNSWDGGDDKIELWQVDIDWNNPANSTISGPIDLFTEPFDSDLCNGSIFDCLAESDGSTVTASMHVLMHRPNYRNLGTHESIVLNHVIDIDGNNRAGVRWYELRKVNGGNWNIFQQGTVASADKHRFMGSIAIDPVGNIALAYSIMGMDQPLSLAFTGRLADDPPGEMTIDEYELATGESLHNGFRWGSHAMMSVDEADGRTFWFTGQYMKENALWGTKITSFRLQTDSLDLAPFKLVNPLNSAFLTENELVKVRLQNTGLISLSDFHVGVIMDDNFISETYFPLTIEPDSFMEVTIEDAIDVSEIRDYHFKIYTRLPGDENVLNDTLWTIISKLPRYDATVNSILNIDNLTCDSVADIGVVIKNIGASPLESLILECSTNGDAINEHYWTGFLEMGKKDTVYLVTDQLYDGLNSISINTLKPNGFEDEAPQNDTLQRTFDVLADGNVLTLDLLTDFYPVETSWQIADDEGNVLLQGTDYEDSNQNYIEEWCLSEGCYEFTIFDDFGDGMSQNGDGHYEIRDEEGHILAVLMEVDFGDMEVSEFCIPFTCNLSGNTSIVLESEFGAYDGIIQLSPIAGMPPFQYSIDNGNTFQDQPVFSGLTGNVYQVMIVDVNGCFFEQELTLETCTVQFSYIATNVTPGQMDGSIEVRPENGVPPFMYSIDNGATFQESAFFEGLDTAIYTVLVQDSLGCTYVQDVQIYETPLSLNNPFDEINIEIIPNPVSDIFTININQTSGLQIEEITLIDITGRVLMAFTLPDISNQYQGSYSIAQYPPGLYFLQFKSGNLKRLEKIVKH